MATHMVGSVPTRTSQLPDYAKELAAFHATFRRELAALVDRLPLGSNHTVLDVGCGDGFYVELFAERLQERGAVVGLDVNDAFLKSARRRLAGRREAAVEFIHADLEDLKTATDEPFDLVWCAQSLYSFPHPEAALRQMGEAARPGGIVAVLENDTLHQLLLPWPSKMEIELRAAERAAFEAESSQPGKFYIGRRLPATLANAGLQPLGYCTQSIDRVGPLDPSLQVFLQSYFETLLERTSPYLSNKTLAELRELTSPDHERYLPRHPYFTLTWLNVLAWGRRPHSPLGVV
jgi:ubiquinone/menaquinone biosynthesis C-methylase UbiE